LQRSYVGINAEWHTLSLILNSSHGSSWLALFLMSTRIEMTCAAGSLPFD